MLKMMYVALIVACLTITGCEQLPLDVINPTIDGTWAGTWEVSDNSITVVFDPVPLTIYGQWSLAAINGGRYSEDIIMTFTEDNRFTWLGVNNEVTGSFALGDENHLTLMYDRSTFTPNNITGTDAITYTIEGSTLSFQFITGDQRTHTYNRID